MFLKYIKVLKNRNEHREKNRPSTEFSAMCQDYLDGLNISMRVCFK